MAALDAKPIFTFGPGVVICNETALDIIASGDESAAERFIDRVKWFEETVCIEPPLIRTAGQRPGL